MNVKIYLNIGHTLLRVCEDEINRSYDCIQTDQDLKIDLVVGEGRKQRSGESGAGGRCQLHPGRWMSFTRSSLLNAQIIFDQHITTYIKYWSVFCQKCWKNANKVTSFKVFIGPKSNCLEFKKDKKLSEV